MRLIKNICVIVPIIAISALVQFSLNLPQEVGEDVPEGKLQSLSFAPFREGQSPLKKIFPSLQEMESDLQLLADKTHSIRTYASSEGKMPALPALAGKYGLTMLQGAWLGKNARDNQKEVEALIAAANAYPDTVTRVIVGNEVLLRGDLDIDELIAYIRKVRQAIKQPVSYADVWSMYMKHPQLIEEVDFITIHILPYWEDEPIAAEIAASHIERAYQLVRIEADQITPDIPILIGETGWPSQGRQRGYAIPGVINQAAFTRAFIAVAAANSFDYNIVEAFNQPWKSALEGIVGANWGLYDANRKQVFPLLGSVQEDSYWWIQFFAATLLFCCLCAVFWPRMANLHQWHRFALLAFLQLASLLLINLAYQHWHSSYTDWQRIGTILNVTMNGTIGYLTFHILLQRWAQAPVSVLAVRWLGYLFLFIAILALYHSMGLARYGRYLSFPSEALILPVASGLALYLSDLLKMRQSFLPSGARIFQALARLVMYLLPLGGLWIIAGEWKSFAVARDFVEAYPDFAQRALLSLQFTLGNTQLLLWLACLILLAFALHTLSRTRPDEA